MGCDIRQMFRMGTLVLTVLVMQAHGVEGVIHTSDWSSGCIKQFPR